MGASGSAWIKPRKRTGLRPEILRERPHPRFVRPGQRFYPLRSQARRVTVKIVRGAPGAEWCDARLEDVGGRMVRLKQARLLAVDGEGNGRHYRFVDFAPRGYATHAYVAAVRDAWVDVICPEWHPSQTIAVAAGSVPESLRERGAWIACRAQLAADKPGLVQPTRFAAPAAHFSPDDLYHLRPDRVADDDRDPPQPPATGPGCGDVVVYIDGEQSGRSSLHIPGHPPQVRPGGRVYLHHGGRVQGWARAEQVRRTPGGTLLRLAADWRPVAAGVAAPPRPPASAVAAGEHGVQLWRWRTWPREPA